MKYRRIKINKTQLAQVFIRTVIARLAKRNLQVGIWKIVSSKCAYFTLCYVKKKNIAPVFRTDAVLFYFYKKRKKRTFAT
jgi:hypothetical protein